MRIKILIPLRIVTGEAKQIIGPYARIRDHYYIALGFMAPDEVSVRWELHVLADPDGILREPVGVASILGYKAIVASSHDWKRLRLLGTETGLKGVLYVPPRRLPLLKVANKAPVGEPLRALMSLYGLAAARKLVEALAASTEIVEV